MSRDRYDDRQLAMMRRLAGTLVEVIRGCGWAHFEGKLAYLKGELEGEEETRRREIATMFVPPRVQLCNLVRWNERRGWGFSDDDVTALEREIPPEPPAAPGRLRLRARVLEIHLPDGRDGTPGHRRTFDELWDIVVREHGARPCHLFGLAEAFGMKDGRGNPLATSLALAPGMTHAPGLRWRTIDLGHGWPDPDPACHPFCGLAPARLPTGIERPHAGILAAAAHFPLWLRRMDGTKVPYVWLPGYELKDVPHDLGKLGPARVTHHPTLTRDREMPFLYMGWDLCPYRDYAVPIYADAETKTDP